MKIIAQIRFVVKHYLYRKWYEKNVMLPYTGKRLVLLDLARRFDLKNFVETGTFLGDTVEALKNDFREIWSIELQPDLAEKAKQRFEDQNHIRILKGDSADILKTILPIQGKTLFWLDGHYSRSFKLNGELISTAKGDSETPILQELAIILKNGLDQNVILIDDARLFNGSNDYPGKKELKRKLISLVGHSFRFEVKNDIIRVLPKKT